MVVDADWKEVADEEILGEESSCWMRKEDERPECERIDEKE